MNVLWRWTSVFDFITEMAMAPGVIGKIMSDGTV
jgi:hypothetical protein